MSIVVFDHYLANIEYMSGDSAGGTELRFRAPDLPSAARGVMRFYEKRASTIPEFFGRLLCVKIYGFVVGEIDADGNYLSRPTMCLFEWKCDGGWTYEQRVDMARRWLERSQQPGVV